MNTFNVLEPQLQIHKNYLLEASAGTGKTFSIENIVVRLLIEENSETGTSLTIEEILAVTFTRAAASDLKKRIRENIEKAIFQLQNPNSDSILPYLSTHFEKGPEAVNKAKKRLEQALFCFDQAHIYTIHGFCAKMLSEHPLEGKMNVNPKAGEDQLPATEVNRVIRNFFRTGVTPKKYCAAQIEQLFSLFSQDSKKMENKLAHVIKKGLPIKERPSFEELYHQYRDALVKIKNSFHFEADKIIEDFEKQRVSFTKYYGVEDPIASVTTFALQFNKEIPSPSDFDDVIRDDLTFVKALAPEKRSKRKNKGVPVELNYPDLHSVLQNKLLPIIEEARSKECIFARIAHDCQKLLKRYCEQEEKTTFDELLTYMQQALENAEFTQNIQSKFRAAIIDEFQDTDPTQWNIFKTLFHENSAHQRCSLYIVGDPKQSIYSFRQADIYTYLSAGEALGKENHATLDTNFRSEKNLIDALNTLFSPVNCPDLIQLPRTKAILPYLEVGAGHKTKAIDFKDGIGNVHFCIAETETTRKHFPPKETEHDLFFPYIVQEIQKLHRSHGLPYKSFAILVAKHSQSDALGQFLGKYGIPYSKQRCGYLSDSPALASLKDIINAAINPKDESAVRQALAGKIIQFNLPMLLMLDDVTVKERCIANLYRLQEELFKAGFSTFYEELLNSCWNPQSNNNVRESLLKNNEQAEFYEDLQQIAEILMEYQCSQHPTPDGLLDYLNEFPIMQINEDEQIKKRSDPHRDAVTLITIHSSKGLEYDIVFALGLVNRSSRAEELIPIFEDGKWMLTALKPEDHELEKAHQREQDAEKMRQLYVAMTRAKHRLYLPTLMTTNSTLKFGQASPMELFLARLTQPPADAEELYKRIDSYETSTLTDFIDRNKEHSLSYSLLKKNEFQLTREEPEQPPLLMPPKKIAIPGVDLHMQSFSSLSLENATEEEIQESGSAPHDFLTLNKTPHTLPAGSETGNLLHTLLENLDFTGNDIAERVNRQTKDSRYCDWNDCLASIIENAMQCQLENFSLKEVAIADTYREMEFVYPVDHEMPRIEEVEYQPGYLKGIIDLIFTHNGKYYLLDWKSNWLGNATEDYTHDKMHQAMQQHHYYLQAALYKKALERYLALTDPRPFQQIFGGTFYLFLRGLSKEPGSKTGIIKIEPYQGGADA